MLRVIRKGGDREEADGISHLQDLPDALLAFIMDFLRGNFTCWASLLVTCRTIHNHHVDHLVKLKLLWEKVQRRGALYIFYFYPRIYLDSKNLGDEETKYIAEALKMNTSLETIHLKNNRIGAEGAKYIAKALKVNTSLRDICLDNNNIGAEGATHCRGVENAGCQKDSLEVQQY